jgi:DNA-binding NtrC family response regulator
VRELENVVERALILHGEGPIRFTLRATEHEDTPGPASPKKTAAPYHDLEKLDDVVEVHIKRILEATGGKVQGKNGAARVLGVNPSTLRNKMKKLGIPYGRNP